MSLRVAYDISAGLAQGGGIGRYARELALALHDLAPSAGLQLSLYANRQPWGQLPPALAAVPRLHAPMNDKLWRLWLLAGAPLPGIPGASDVVHGADVIVPHSAAPAVITVHDLTPYRFPDFHTRLNRTFLRAAFPVMARRAAAIIAVSEATRRDLVNLVGVDAGKITRIYEGVNREIFTPLPVDAARAQIAPALGFEGPYLLALGTLEPRKNLATLLRAYTALPASAPPLVLAGAQGWGDTGLTQVLDKLDLRRRVFLPGRMPDQLLSALYAGAEAFVYPSFYEGFGLPVLEAMTCGAPVITSNCSSLPEVTGDAAILIDPTDSDALTAALTLVIQTPELRAHMRTLGLQQAQQFSWRSAAQQTIDLYRHVAGRVGR